MGMIGCQMAMVVAEERCSDWKCASTDGCEPEWWNKQLM